MSELRTFNIQAHVEGKSGLTELNQITKAVKDVDAATEALKKQLGEETQVTVTNVKTKKELTKEATNLLTQISRNEKQVAKITEQYRVQTSVLGQNASATESILAVARLHSTATDEQRKAVASAAEAYLVAKERQEQLTKAELEAAAIKQQAITQTDQLQKQYRNLAGDIGKTKDQLQLQNALMSLGAGATAAQRNAVKQAVEQYQKLNREYSQNIAAQKNKINQERIQKAELDKVEQSVKNLTLQYQQQAKMIDMTANEAEQYRAVMALGSKATDAQREQVRRSVAEYQRLRDAAGGAQGSLRNTRGVMQNVGWQMQDTIVQLQMGTSAFVVLSQQGSQMAAAFGPTGAIVGAFIALAGVIGGTLFKGLMDSTKASDKLKTSMENVHKVINLTKDGTIELTEEFRKLYEVDKNLATLRMQVALLDAEKAMRQSKQSIAESFKEIGLAWYNLTLNDLAAGGKGVDYINNLTTSITGLDKSSDKFYSTASKVRWFVKQVDLFKDGKGNIDEFGNALRNLDKIAKPGNDKFTDFVRTSLDLVVQFQEGKITADKLRDALKNIGSVVEETGDQFLKAKSDSDSFISSLAYEAATLGMTSNQLKEYKINLMSISDVDKAVLRGLNDRINLYHTEKKELENFNSLNVKLTKTIDDEYKRRYDIIKAYSDNIGADQKAVAKAYVDLEKWKTDEEKNESDKRKDQATRDYNSREAIRRQIERAQVTQAKKDDPLQGEMDQFGRNLLVLAEQKRQTEKLGEAGLAERQRINALIEAEVLRHNSAMEAANLTSFQNTVSVFAMAQTQVASIVNLMTTGVQDVRNQMAEMNGFQKAMFLTAQVVAAANAVVSGIDLGMKLAAMFPLAAPAMIATGTGIGAAQAGTIMGVTLAGAFDKGGYIPQGQAGIVAEYGNELVNGQLVMGPANVTSREDTAAMMGGSTKLNVSIENRINGAGYQVKQIDENTVKIIAEQVFANNIDQGVSQVIGNGNSKTAKSMRQSYNVQRNLNGN